MNAIITVRNSSCGKVKFLHLSVIAVIVFIRGGMCGIGSVHCEGGHVWQKGCARQGACMVGGMHGRGRAWQGACVAGAKATPADGTHPTGMHCCITL